MYAMRLNRRGGWTLSIGIVLGTMLTPANMLFAETEVAAITTRLPGLFGMAIFSG